MNESNLPSTKYFDPPPSVKYNKYTETPVTPGLNFKHEKINENRATVVL